MNEETEFSEHLYNKLKVRNEFNSTTRNVWLVHDYDVFIYLKCNFKLVKLNNMKELKNK